MERGVNVAKPVAWSMSVVAAVYVDEVGEIVSCRRAGFTIVAGLSSVTVGEHFPELPDTLHVSTVCAAAVAVAKASADQIASAAIAKRVKLDRLARRAGLTARLLRRHAFPFAVST
jgi:hypothetical protein